MIFFLRMLIFFSTFAPQFELLCKIGCKVTTFFLKKQIICEKTSNIFSFGRRNVL